MFTIAPKKEPFFDMFDQSAQNVHAAAKALLEFLEHFEDPAGKARLMKELEHQGDEVTHRIMEKLAKSFITPLDREDIQRAASRLDDILDEMDSAAHRMVLYRITSSTEEAKTFARILVKATGALMQAFSLLRNLKKSGEILALCVEVHTQENEADRVHQEALGSLFDGPFDAKDIIKWKDVYQLLEKAVDRCEDVADVLHTIVVKNS